MKKRAARTPANVPNATSDAGRDEFGLLAPPDLRPSGCSRASASAYAEARFGGASVDVEVLQEITGRERGYTELVIKSGDAIGGEGETDSDVALSIRHPDAIRALICALLEVDRMPIAARMIRTSVSPLSKDGDAPS